MFKRRYRKRDGIASCCCSYARGPGERTCLANALSSEPAEPSGITQVSRVTARSHTRPNAPRPSAASAAGGDISWGRVWRHRSRFWVRQRSSQAVFPLSSGQSYLDTLWYPKFCSTKGETVAEPEVKPSQKNTLN